MQSCRGMEFGSSVNEYNKHLLRRRPGRSSPGATHRPPATRQREFTTDNSNSIANATSTAQQPGGPTANNSSTAVTTTNAQQGSSPLANASAGIGTNLDITA